MLKVIEANNHPKGIIAIDTETSGWSIRDGRDICIGVSCAGKLSDSVVLSGYYPFNHKGEGNLEVLDKFKLKESLETFQGHIVFHNALFDLPSLATIGINYVGKFYDTMLMAHLINENFPYTKGLDECVKTYVNKDEHKKNSPGFKAIVKLVGWGGVPVNVMSEYAAYDADLTLRLYEKIKPMFDKEVPSSYWEHKQKLVRCIDTMQRRGVLIDQALCTRMTAIGETVMEECEQILGYKLSSPIDLEKLLIQDLKLPVLKMGKVRPSFDKGVMQQYEEILERRPDEDTTAQTVLSFRGWQKAVTSSYKPYVELVSPDGRLRCNYKLHGTKTGRLSCEKPNLQQIPRVSNREWNGKMKQCFVAQEGFSLYEADYSQAELRIAAAYGQQKNLIAILDDPARDTFTEMGKELGFTRQDTKTLTYSIQYGAGATRISNVFNVSLDRGKQIRDHFWETYPGIKKITDLASHTCAVKGKVKLWTGRYRHFMYPDQDSYQAFSGLCQGGVADLVGYTMVRLFEQVDNEAECRMLLQVHDSIVFEIRNDKIDEYLPRIKQAMENDNPAFGVTFPVDIHKFGQS